MNGQSEHVVPRTFHWTWLGPRPLPPQYAAYQQRWLKLHPKWNGILWTEKSRPRLHNEQLYAEATTWAGKSDILRLELLAEHGGVFLDCHVEPLRNIEPLLNGHSLCLPYESPCYLTTRMMASAKGHPTVLRFIEEIRRRWVPGRLNVSMASGPLFVDRVLIDPALYAGVARLPWCYFQPDNNERSHAYACFHGTGSWISPATFTEEHNPVPSLRTMLDYGSHLPLTRIIGRHLPTAVTVECGSGDISTGHLLRQSREFWAVEHDSGWAEVTRNRFSDDSRFHIITRGLPIIATTEHPQMTTAQIEKTRVAYQGIAAELPAEIDLLFVDTFSGARIIALEALAARAKTVVIHDTHPPHNWTAYCYDRFAASVPNWIHLSLQPDGYPWTDLFTREPLDVNKLREDVLSEAFLVYGPKVRVRLVARGLT
jgi:Glycosyltransferase sugar-binding region containing DXD motif